MKKALIVYYSQHGTTAAIAENIAEGIRPKNYSVESVNIRDEKPGDLLSYDLLVIGSPVYYFRPAYNILDMIKDFPSLNGMPVAFFLMYGTHSFNACRYLEKILNKKGADVKGYSQYTGDDLYLGYLREGYLFSPDHPDRSEKTRAKKFGEDLVDAVDNQTGLSSPARSMPGPVYMMEKLFYFKWMIRHFHSRFLKAHRKKCNNCGTCAGECPTGNISQREDGKMVFGRNCILCLTCQLKCPREAVSSTLDWFLMKPFLVYNTRSAAKNPGIDTVRVKFAKGRIERLPSE
jgi:flavodoxin/Pyruvate/2-oxoacid:ferredoxin oxidoreductase delta subunit